MVKEKQNSIRTFSIASKSEYGDSIVTQMSFDVADSLVGIAKCCSWILLLTRSSCDDGPFSILFQVLRRS